MPTMSDWFSADATLSAIVARDVDGPWAQGAPAFLSELAHVAQARVAPLSWLADRHPPTLRTHDPFGERIDEIVYHPAYRELQRIAYDELGLVAMRHDGASFDMPAPAPQTLAFAATFLFAQAEAGVLSPICTTDGVARVIARFGDDALRRDLLPRLCARGPARVTGAVFATERAGGSDLALCQAVATRDGSGFRLSGDKWFCSNVDAGVILTLARCPPPEGTPTGAADEAPSGTAALGLFVVEPLLPDGRRNGLTIHRLKDKLGVRSMPTGEVSFHGAWARLVGHGPPDQGFQCMAELINVARLHNAVVSVALMRRALTECLGWVSSRQAFGRKVVDHPLAIENLADLAAETQGATHLVFDAVRRLGRKDQGAATTTDERVLRLLTPLCKYYTAKLAVWAASEGLELCGGNGYIEEFVTPRLLRDAQVLPIWEGTTNLCVLDALRALRKGGTAEALFSEAERKMISVRGPRLRPLAEGVRRHLDRLSRSLARLSSFSSEVLLHHARPLTDAIVQAFEVALAIQEADRLDEVGQGGRDFLVAERLLSRHLERPSLETVGPRHVDPLRLQVLLGERRATVAEVA
jgi:alkylation response protein AidB-like acyl-CoA dehydrogenase